MDVTLPKGINDVRQFYKQEPLSEFQSDYNLVFRVYGNWVPNKYTVKVVVKIILILK